MCLLMVLAAADLLKQLAMCSGSAWAAAPATSQLLPEWCHKGVV